MEISNLFESVLLPLLGGTVGAIAIVKYLSKRLVEHQFQKEIEDHKASLEKQTESLKHDLSIFAHEKNVKNSRVDAQTAEAIKNVYSAVVVLLKNANDFANGKPRQVTSLEEYDDVDTQKASEFRFYKEKAELTSASAKKLEEVLLENAIFMDSSVYQKIEFLYNRFYELSESYVQTIIEEECGRDDLEAIADNLAVMRKSLSDYYNSQLMTLRDDIIQIFRTKLGIEKI